MIESILVKKSDLEAANSALTELRERVARLEAERVYSPEFDALVRAKERIAELERERDELKEDLRIRDKVADKDEAQLAWHRAEVERLYGNWHAAEADVQMLSPRVDSLRKEWETTKAQLGYAYRLIRDLIPPDAYELFVERMDEFRDGKRQALSPAGDGGKATPQERAEEAYQRGQRTFELNQKICEMGACIHPEHQKPAGDGGECYNMAERSDKVLEAYGKGRD